MNRRKFLKKTSVGIAAATLFPLLSFQNQEYSTTDRYEAFQKLNVNGKNWHFKFFINSVLYQDFKGASADNKSMIFDGYQEGELMKLIYKIASVTTKKIGEKNLHLVQCKIEKDRMTENDYKFAKDNFGKEVIIEIEDKSHATVKNEGLKFELKFHYIKVDNATCFLTSACVYHKGLPDNCKELTMLRNLRENVMKPNAKYKSLISEYEIIAPQMLININQSNNKNEVLDYIYSQLVQPSISLIEQGKNDAAIEHYTQFVQKMKKHYL